MTEYIKTDDTVFFTANFYHPISGFSYSADTTPRWLVYEAGATVILQGDMTARALPGAYWGSCVASAANGFDSNQFYDIQVSGTVAGVTGFSSVKEFVVDDIYNVNIVQVSGIYVYPKSVYNANIVQVSGVDIYFSETMDANIVSISGIPVSPEDTVDANIVSVSGVQVSLGDFGGTSTGASAVEIRQEMDANSLKLTAISGSVAGLAGAAMRGTDNAATAVSLSALSGTMAGLMWNELMTGHQTAGSTGYALNVASGNLIGVAGSITAADVYAQASGALVAYDVVNYGDLVSRTLASGDYFDYVNDMVRANIVQVSGQNVIQGGIVDVNVVQVSGQYVHLNDFHTDLSGLDADIYFAHIKFVSDLTNNQDEFAVQWFKNDQPVSSGQLTNPRISAYNTATGAAVFAGQSMAYASPSLGVVRYNTTMVLASGEPYLVETSGTIDSVMRSWKTIIGIDLL